MCQTSAFSNAFQTVVLFLSDTKSETSSGSAKRHNYLNSLFVCLGFKNFLGHITAVSPSLHFLGMQPISGNFSQVTVFSLESEVGINVLQTPEIKLSWRNIASPSSLKLGPQTDSPTEIKLSRNFSSPGRVRTRTPGLIACCSTNWARQAENYLTDVAEIVLTP